MASDVTIHQIDKNEDSIHMTPAAILHLQKQIEKRGKGIGMHLSLEKSGCSGYGYVTEIIDTCQMEDKQFVLANKLILTVAVKDYPFLRGIIIDFVTEGLNSRFKFMNPNEKNACGCGESVGF